MAIYKVVDADQLDADMTALANTIRTKGGTSGKLAWPAGYQSAVLAIETGKDVSAVTATAADVISGKVFVDSAGNQVTGTLVVQTYYYGADEPSADLGVDGDICFVMG